MIDTAVAAIRAGEPIVLPTDTVYGLCANPYREEYARRLYRLKGRPESQPTALLASDVDMLLELIPELRGRAAAIARALLPGAYTLIFQNPARRFRWLNGDRPDTIGIRVPVFARSGSAVLERVEALMATSANLAGEPDPRRLDDVPSEIRSACGAVVDGGELPGVPSTVIDFTAAEPRVVREGAGPVASALGRAREAVD